jgi:uncharacterized protein (DUF934 family)
MAQLIRNRSVAPDTWQLLEPQPGADSAIPADGDVIVPLSVWTGARSELERRAGRTGVWLDGGEDPGLIATDLERLPLVAVMFRSFGDGRGFSIARLLRERYGYRGELRAVGYVIQDWLLFMQRCGFDAFLLREGEDPASALAAFAELPEAYQSSVAEPQPLFRRRLAKGAQGTRT